VNAACNTRHDIERCAGSAFGRNWIGFGGNRIGFGAAHRMSGGGCKQSLSRLLREVTVRNKMVLESGAKIKVEGTTCKNYHHLAGGASWRSIQRVGGSSPGGGVRLDEGHGHWHGIKAVRTKIAAPQTALKPCANDVRGGGGRVEAEAGSHSEPKCYTFSPCDEQPSQVPSHWRCRCRIPVLLHRGMQRRCEVLCKQRFGIIFDHVF
jgi:hypothetical protein